MTLLDVYLHHSYLHAKSHQRRVFTRYFLEIQGGSLEFDTALLLHWDDDDFAARTLNFYVIVVVSFTGRTVDGFGFSVSSLAYGNTYVILIQ